MREFLLKILPLLDEGYSIEITKTPKGKVRVQIKQGFYPNKSIEISIEAINYTDNEMFDLFLKDSGLFGPIGKRR